MKILNTMVLGKKEQHELQILFAELHGLCGGTFNYLNDVNSYVHEENKQLAYKEISKMMGKKCIEFQKLMDKIEKYCIHWKS